MWEEKYMTHEDWAVDRLHTSPCPVRLPAAAAPGRVPHNYLTTIENLALELERWVRAAEQLEATRPLIEATRACTAGRDALSGELETRDLTVDIRRDTEPHQEIGVDRDQGAAGPGGSISLRATSTRTSAIWELALPPGAMATV